MFARSSFIASEDILRGAAKIAEFLFGNPAERRKVYYLIERGYFPTFRLGGYAPVSQR
jgi:hypothetical protein